MWFIGVPVSCAVEELVPATSGLAATRVGDRHVTFAFLGRAPDAAVTAVWSSLPSLPLPPTTRPLRWERFGRSAIALVVSDDDGLLDAAAGACHDAADGLIELQPPSPFRPHVTMARVPRRGRPPSASTLADWPLPPGALEVGPLTLFRSRPQPGGDRYERVEEQPAAP